ncbi:hypothetical protein HAX54_016039 [Datura stramonium]|uniref:Uncharacterized protein n=1 Tax=Datura stramonium TaxID=4076 RepID=A0ABS8UIY8_DATST|nr:hypothetical protein [Datura stramonium]
MATPHIAGIVALIKEKHPSWSPTAITSAMMTTADVTGHSRTPILAQKTNQLASATPFDFGAGLVNPSREIDPGFVFKSGFKHYVLFLCSVPGVDDMSIRRAVGVGCPKKKRSWCSDLNTPSVTISNLVGSRNVFRRVTVAGVDEKYQVIVKEPLGVSVSVTPQVFKVNANASRHVNIALNATQTTNTYSFGEIMFQD